MEAMERQENVNKGSEIMMSVDSIESGNQGGSS